MAVALAYIRENPGVNTLQLDQARRTARNGHQWMYRTVDRLYANGYIDYGPVTSPSGRGVGLYAKETKP
jgi:hypothetical protein